jgi:high-affinity iron transporter
VNLSLFFQVTAIFLFVFVVQLVVRGVHEMSEQNMLPWSELLHAKTEAWGPDSPFGHLLTYFLVLLPFGWLAFKSAFFTRSITVPRMPERVDTSVVHPAR